MTVHFIGAGPGDPDLITVRGRDLIARCPVCLYAGSLVPKAVVAYAPAGARVIDTASLDLPQIIAEIEAAHAAGLDVARVHSGDPSIYGATAEQFAALEARNIPFEITPGVPAFAAAAARLKVELTAPEVAQTITLSRLAGRASAMPPAETLEAVAAAR
ncbi:cobalt-precorrin-4/precorrin-4 C(11)-methyltransferase, partial [Methylopila musalis]